MLKSIILSAVLSQFITMTGIDAGELETILLPKKNLKELLTVRIDSSGGGIENVLHGFARLAEGARCLLTEPESALSGAHCLMEGIAQLTACAIHQRSGNDSEQILVQVEELLAELDYKIITLINTYAKHAAHKEQGLHSKDVPADLAPADDAKGNEQQSPAAGETAHIGLNQADEQRLVEGLTEIFYNMFCMLLNPNDIGFYLKRVFAGLFKVIAAILADGKIDKGDLEVIGAALGAIFNFRENAAITVAGHSKLTFASNAVNDDVVIRTPFETKEMSSGLSLIMHSLMSIITDPRHTLQYLQQIISGIVHIIISILADGKIDAHDIETAGTALEQVVVHTPVLS